MLNKGGFHMPYNQITPGLTIAPGPDPVGPSRSQICKIIDNALINDGYTVNWINKSHQPYQLQVDNGINQIDLYIYAWRITNGGRSNLVNEKRIEIRRGVNNIGFSRPITATQKTLLLGIYDSPSGTPVFAAWDATDPRNMGVSQKSCQVKVQELLNGILNGINTCLDTQGNTIYTFTPSFLGDYIDLVQAGNVLPISTVTTTAGTTTTTRSLSSRVRSAALPGRRARTVRSTSSILNSISRLNQTEKDAVVKQRIGQGLFKDLLKNKYGCKCVLCNITTESMLVASHIKKWSDCTNDTERLDDNNGLLLCSHHDALFDKHLISFDEHTGALIVSPTLSAAEQATLNIASIPNITVTPQMVPYMADHHSKLKV